MITLKPKLSSTENTIQTFDQTIMEQILPLYPRLKHYCLSLTKNVWDSEDLAHETIAKVMSYYGQRDNQKETTITLSLCCTIAKHKWIDIVRKHVRTEELKEGHGNSYEPMNQLPEVHAVLEELLKEFTLQQTVIFMLKDVFHYSLKEIADSLSTTEGAVKSTLFRIRTRIQANSSDPTEPSQPDQWLKEYFLRAIQEEKPELLIELMTGSTRVEPYMVSHVVTKPAVARRVQTSTPTCRMSVLAS